MSKLVLYFVVTGAINIAVAAKKPIYQATFHLKQDGKVLESSSVTVEEGRGGAVNSITENGYGTAFGVTVKPTQTKQVEVDYRFKSLMGTRNIEIAKGAAAFELSKAEVNKFEDSSGNHFQLEVTISKK